MYCIRLYSQVKNLLCVSTVWRCHIKMVTQFPWGSITFWELMPYAIIVTIKVVIIADADHWLIMNMSDSAHRSLAAMSLSVYSSICYKNTALYKKKQQKSLQSKLCTIVGSNQISLLTCENHYSQLPLCCMPNQPTCHVSAFLPSCIHLRWHNNPLILVTP